MDLVHDGDGKLASTPAKRPWLASPSPERGTWCWQLVTVLAL
jgi:hypothetical protein